MTPSAETRAKISASLLGRKLGPQSAEHRAKIGAAHRGEVKSAEHRAKLGLAMLGNPGPRGIKRSEETRAKISETLRGNQRVRNAPIKGTCVYCLSAGTTFDHVIPRGRPGWDDPDNRVVACQSCNSQKRSRTPEEWFAGYRLRESP